MDIFRFQPDRLSAELAKIGEGDAFQRLTHELLLPEYPGLHLFPTGGKDGGIDLVALVAGGRAVFECKHIGEDGLAPAEARWGEVVKHLDKHLASPEGPTKGQAQYRPWFESDTPIVEYVFCISSVLANESQRSSLERSISTFFQELAGKRPHLAHLAAMRARVLDASDFATRLNLAPPLRQDSCHPV